MRDVNKSTLYIEVNGKQVKFETKLTFDQVDKKVIKELCGCNGSYWYVSSTPFLVSVDTYLIFKFHSSSIHNYIDSLFTQIL